MQSECKEHPHISDEEIAKILQQVQEHYAMKMNAVQLDFEKQNACQGDFITVLVNSAINIMLNAMQYLEHVKAMERQELLNLFLGGVAQKAGATFISLQQPRTPSTAPQNLH